MSYGGEYLVSTTRRLEKKKLEITNFKNLINLNYSSARTYTEKTCFISKQNKYLMLEVGDGDNRETVKFIRKSDGFVFSNLNEVNVVYTLNGDYMLNERTITFELNGDIRGSDSWSAYQLLRAGYRSVDDRKNTYNLASFKGRDEGTYAIQVNHGELLVWRYESMDKGDYLIKLSATPIYTLRKKRVAIFTHFLDWKGTEFDSGQLLRSN
jgi:hypothetical protein